MLESSFHGVSKKKVLHPPLQFKVHSCPLVSWEGASKWKTRLVHPKVWRVQNLDMTPNGVSEENKALGNMLFAIRLLGSLPVIAQEPVLEMVRYRELQPSQIRPLSACICKDVHAYTKQQIISRDS